MNEYGAATVKQHADLIISKKESRFHYLTNPLFYARTTSVRTHFYIFSAERLNSDDFPEALCTPATNTTIHFPPRRRHLSGIRREICFHSFEACQGLICNEYVYWNRDGKKTTTTKTWRKK